MNKYFLSIIFIFIIFLSARLFDEVFFNAKELKKSYNIITIVQVFQEHQSERDNLKEAVDIEKMLRIANVRNCKKLLNKHSNCHDVASKSKIIVRPPIWKFVGRELEKMEWIKYSNTLKNQYKIWDYEELFYILESPKKYISGTKMNLGGIPNQVEIEDFVVNLSSLK